MKQKTSPGLKIISLNRKASFNFFFENIYEAGLVLKGSEIKSNRSGKVNISDAYAIERDGEIIVKDLSIEFGDDDTAQIDELNNEKIDNKFVSLKDQLDKEFTSWDDYGSNVINRL